jgi:rhodanese-related sulfurtransferase
MAFTPIDPAILMSMLETDPDLQVVDVRMPQECLERGYLSQARLIPLHELPYAFRVLDLNKPVVVVCEHGVRSIDACYFLQAQGVKALYSLNGGMSAWTGPVIFPEPLKQPVEECPS